MQLKECRAINRGPIPAAGPSVSLAWSAANGGLRDGGLSKSEDI